MSHQMGFSIIQLRKLNQKYQLLQKLEAENTELKKQKKLLKSGSRKGLASNVFSTQFKQNKARVEYDVDYNVKTYYPEQGRTLKKSKKALNGSVSSFDNYKSPQDIVR